MKYFIVNYTHPDEEGWKKFLQPHIDFLVDCVSKGYIYSSGQLHNYGRHFLFDFYYQKYKGFYHQEKNTIQLYPDLTVQQIGMETSYLFNGNKFSAKAAFEQSEKQLKSAGSFLMGGGFYWHKLKPNIDSEILEDTTFNNLQFGFNSGYAHSWVLDKHWLLTSMVSVGANVGNEINALGNGKIKIYPTAQARASSTYNHDDWSLSFSMLINNKTVYPNYGSLFSLTSLSIQLAYVRQLDNIFKKK